MSVLAGELNRAGERARAVRLLRRSIDLLAAGGFPLQRAEALEALAKVRFDQGRLSEAEPLHRESMRVFRRLEAVDLLAEAGMAWGRVKEAQEALPAARRLYRRAIELYCSVGNERGAANARLALGGLELWVGRYDESAALIEQARPTLERTAWHRESLRLTQAQWERLAGGADPVRLRGWITEALDRAQFTKAAVEVDAWCERGRLQLLLGRTAETEIRGASAVLQRHRFARASPWAAQVRRLSRAQRAWELGRRLFRGEVPGELPDRWRHSAGVETGEG